MPTASDIFYLDLHSAILPALKDDDDTALQKSSQYIECSCPCEVVRVVNVHVELVATFKMKGNTSKVAAMQIDVLEQILHAVEDAIEVFLWFLRLPLFPP